MGEYADEIVDRMANSWPRRRDAALAKMERFFSAEGVAERERRYKEAQKGLAGLLDDLPAEDNDDLQDLI